MNHPFYCPIYYHNDTIYPKNIDNLYDKKDKEEFLKENN